MKNSVLLKILITIALAVVAGYFSGTTHGLFGVPFVKVYGLIGKMFLNALTLVVVPLVAASIITGTARIGGEQAIGSLGLKTLGAFVGTTLCAILIALTFTLLISPGTRQKIELPEVSVLAKAEIIEKNAEIDGFQRFEQIILKLVPSNILAAASQGQMLGIIAFCFLFGYFLPKIDPHAGGILLGFWKGIFEVMMKITLFVMKALPIGVFGLVAQVVATSGLNSFTSTGWFFLTVIVGLTAYMFVVLPTILKLLARVSPIAHFKAMSPALVTAFSTSSSSATLPVTIECVEKEAGISNRICSFVIPLGTAINLSGTSLHQCAAALFIAQAYGLEMSVATVLTVAIMTLLMSFGMAGIPSASLISTVLILETLGLPGEGIALVVAIDRVVDMCRTTVSVFGNSCCAVLVARSEGEKTLLVPHSKRTKKAAV